MKRAYVFLFLFFVLLFHGLSAVGPDSGGTGSRINFGSRDSAFKFSSGTKFYNQATTDSLVIDGTIEKDENAEFKGNRISFQNGVFEVDGSQMLLTAGLLPMATNPDQIWLIGDSSFDAEPGTVVEKIYVDGTNNRLEGQPVFTRPISFYDSAATLTIALQNKLNNNIELNSGLLRLEEDLRLCDNVYLIGPGLIKLNNCQLALGSYYANAWDKGLIFDHSTDVVLHGKTDLTATWTFVGESRINGNGNVLDLSNNGKIYVSPGSTLYLSDIEIAGLGDNSSGQSYGKLEIGTGSQIRTSNVFVSLDKDYTTSIGDFYVEGPTTFILGGKNWTFNGDSLLTVDHQTLWLDTLADVDWSNPGELKAPLPLYAGHYWQYDNLVYDLAHNLSLINSGTVKEVCDRSQALSSESTALTRDPLTSDLELDQSIDIHPLQKIVVADSLTIDGRGASIRFSDPDNSQFVVLAGKTVTLKNVTFENISRRTFDLRYIKSIDAQGNRIVTDGQIRLGEDVKFMLSDDVTFSQGKLILGEVGQSDSSQIQFSIYGIGGEKNLNFAPDSNLYNYKVGTRLKEYMVRNLVDLGHNEIFFQNLNVTGLEHFVKTDVDLDIYGKIILGGSTDFNVGDMQTALTSQQVWDMNFLVSGIDNKLRLLKNNMKFTGKLEFSDYNDNDLHFDFMLTENILGTNKDNWWAGGMKKVNFGVGFITLTSANGIARLFFDDAVINVINEFISGSGYAFSADKNSYLYGKEIIVSGDYIRDLYDPNVAGNPFVTEIEKLRATSDLNYVPMINAQETLGIRSVAGLFSKSQNNLNKGSIVKDLQDQEEQAQEELVTERTVIPPVGKLINYLNTITDLSQAKDNLMLYRSQGINFSIDPDIDLNITLTTNSSLELTQGGLVTLKTNDVINIVGPSNQIDVYGTFNLEGRLQFAANSQLTFNLVDDDSVVEFGPNITLDLEPGVELRFTGKGTVKFKQHDYIGASINLKGTSSENYPSLIITEGVYWGPADGACITIHGKGKVWASAGAVIYAYNSAEILVGSLTTDDIEISLFDSAQLLISDSARMSCRYANIKFNVEMSTVWLDHSGILEFNSNNQIYVKGGNISELIFSPGSELSIFGGAKLVLGYDLDSSTGQLSTIHWDSRSTSFYGDSFIKYVTKPTQSIRQFEGQLRGSNFENTSINAESLVKILVNQVSALSNGAVFTNASGIRTLRVPSGTQVALQITAQGIDDTIESESGSGTGYVAFGKTKTGQRVNYNYKGTRILSV